jgi:hypothetical protein
MFMGGTPTPPMPTQGPQPTMFMGSMGTSPAAGPFDTAQQGPQPTMFMGSMGTNPAGPFDAQRQVEAMSPEEIKSIPQRLAGETQPVRVITEPAENYKIEPEYYERIVEVPKIQIEERERLIEVPQPMMVDVVREVPQVQEVLHELPGPVDVRMVTREVPKVEVRHVERVVEVAQIEYQDRFVEVPEVQEVVRRIPRVEVHEIPIERIIQVPKKIVQEVIQPIYRPVPHLVQQAVEREIPVPRVQMQTMEVVRQMAVTEGQAPPARSPEWLPQYQQQFQQLPPQQVGAPQQGPAVQSATVPQASTAMGSSFAGGGMSMPATAMGSGFVGGVPSLAAEAQPRPGNVTPPTPPVGGSSQQIQVGPPTAGVAPMGSMGYMPGQSYVAQPAEQGSVRVQQLPASRVMSGNFNPFASAAPGGQVSFNPAQQQNPFASMPPTAQVPSSAQYASMQIRSGAALPVGPPQSYPSYASGIVGAA